jgi:hypothetical protein
MLEPYQTHGFADRAEYLDFLCEEYPRDVVYGLANMLGRNEDFDGLVTALQDFSEDFYQ